jgi:hypothetical protein
MRRTATSRWTDGYRPTRKVGTCAVRRSAPDRATRDAARAEGHEPGTGGAEGSPKIPADGDPGVNRGFTMFGEDDGKPWGMVGIRPPAPSAERSEADSRLTGPSEARRGDQLAGPSEAGQAKIDGDGGDDRRGPGGARRGDPFAGQGGNKQGRRGARRGDRLAGIEGGDRKVDAKERRGGGSSSADEAGAGTQSRHEARKNRSGQA